MYIIEHLYEVDGGIGDAVPNTDVVGVVETEEEAKSYIVPDWFGREVTYESAYHNSTISKYGMPADLK
jgi:CYTH domain-containing protein